ncbi:MAG TPA: aldehyde dehydrogenase family protein, partial [Xanthomonadales bacterium]|nr:aldehyde dehydrogenase family protein [Xanthomonadales bacterium]
MLTSPRTVTVFRNEPIRDFADPADRRSLEDALVRARADLGRRYPLVIGGEKLHGTGTIASINPARPNEIVGVVDEASIPQVSAALDAATAAFATWKKTSAQERADLLFRAAARIRETKDDWNAVLVLEVGKPWIEADADTAEAIDFLEFYGREALR